MSEPQASSTATGQVALGPEPTRLLLRLEGRLPRVTETLRVAETVRRAAMARYGRAQGGAASAALAGKAPGGLPLTGHGHAFYWPLDLDGDGRLDHVLIHVPAGLSQWETRAVHAIDAVVDGKGLDLRVSPQSPVVRPMSGRTWRSATPFVLPRHPKPRAAGGRGRDLPLQQLHRELRHHGLPAPERSDEVDELPCGGELVAWGAFAVHRSRPAAAGGLRHGFRIRFPRAVDGPFALGHACHFGLGLFLPDLDDAPSR